METKSTHILIIANGDFFSTYGGGQVYVKNLVDEMINQQLNLSVISFVNRKEAEIQKKNYLSIDLVEVSVKDEDLVRNLIKDIAPDVVHIHAEKALIAGICKRLSIPCIITAHHGGIVDPAGAMMTYQDKIRTEPISHESSLPDVLNNIRGGLLFYLILKHISLSWRLKLGRFLSKIPFIYFVTPIGMASLSIERKMTEWRSIVENTDLMIAPSSAIADAMVLNGMPKEKIRVVRHGIPIISKNVDAFLIEDRSVKFFYVGRISYIKGIHILLKAFTRLKRCDCELHLVGDIQNNYAKRLVRKYKKKKNIVFHGKVAPVEIMGYISKFDILVHPTICMEIYGLNIAEALSMSKPVIATRCGGAEMQIEDGKNGVLVEPNNVKELREAMEWVMRHPMDLLEMSEQAPLNVVSIEKHVLELNQLYTDLYNEKRD